MVINMKKNQHIKIKIIMMRSSYDKYLEGLFEVITFKLSLRDKMNLAKELGKKECYR